MPRRVLVVTVVHHPWDARIWHRQITAVLDRGWQVTYAAPFKAYGLDQPHARQNLRAVDLPRATGRRRWAAQRAAREVLRRCGPSHDVVLLHDPELLTATVGLSLPPVVWDVHEDTAAAVEIREWIPDVVRRPLAHAIRAVEHVVERRHTLLLADAHYARRFRRPHTVIPNTTDVPITPVPAGQRDAAGRRRVVYLGSVTVERGVLEMVDVGRRISAETDGELVLDVIGPGHGDAGDILAAAHAAGHLRWRGFVPNDEALRLLDGALAGLSLLHDAANFRPSMPTKVVEYLAHAVPVITTDLPVPAALVRRSGGGIVVPFHDTERAVSQLLQWHADPAAAAARGRAGYDVVKAEYDWKILTHDFVSALEAASTRGGER